jgi:hypothetical protein
MIRIFSDVLTPRQKLIFGLIFIPAFLLQESLIVRFVQFLILISLFIFYGGRFRILPNIILFFGIVLAYTLQPAGKLIFMLGVFPITRGALFSGISRSLMLIGLIYLSRLSISSKLKFKGTLGNLIGRVFYYFEAVTGWKNDFNFKNIYKPGDSPKLIEYIDELLQYLETKEDNHYLKKDNHKEPFSLFAVILTFLFIVFSYFMLLPQN